MPLGEVRQAGISCASDGPGSGSQRVSSRLKCHAVNVASGALTHPWFPSAVWTPQWTDFQAIFVHELSIVLNDLRPSRLDTAATDATIAAGDHGCSVLTVVLAHAERDDWTVNVHIRDRRISAEIGLNGIQHFDLSAWRGDVAAWIIEAAAYVRQALVGGMRVRTTYRRGKESFVETFVRDEHGDHFRFSWTRLLTLPIGEKQVVEETVTFM